MRGAFRDLIGHELDGRGQPDGQVAAQFLAQRTGLLHQQLRDLGLQFGFPEHRVVHGGVLQVVGDPGVGDGHVVDPLVLDDIAQRLRHEHLHALGQAGGTG